MKGTKVNQTTGAILLAIATGVFLAAVKITAGFLTHSMAIMASALDSLMDVGASFVNLIAARKAAKPPDEDHAYGHGKVESLAALFQSLFIGLSGLYVILESVKRLLQGSEVEEISVGVGMMLFSIVINGALVWRINTVAKRTKSLILATEKLHFSMDILTNGGVILALVLVYFTNLVYWDFVVSIGIAIYIFMTSFKILRRSVDELLDRGLPPVSKGDIENMIFAHSPSIVGFHNFRSRYVGEQIFLDFHIEIRGENDFKRAHDLTEGMIQKIQKKYPGADVTVHFDPEGAD